MTHPRRLRRALRVAHARRGGAVRRPEQHCSGPDDWRRMIAAHGWAVVTVTGWDGEASFTFTAGLTERDLPELVVYGLAAPVAAYALDELARRLVAGEDPADGELLTELVGEVPVQLRAATRVLDRLGAAFELYGEERVRVRQLVVPDLDGRWPWETGYDLFRLQPLLSEPPVAVPPEVARRLTGLPGGLDPDVEAATHTVVASGARPPVLVCWHADGEIVVLGEDDVTGGAGSDTEAPLGLLVEEHPVVARLLAEMHPGTVARSDGAAWYVDAHD